MAITWITPTEVTPGSTGWQDVNVSAYVPAGATGVICHIDNKVTTTYVTGYRNNGSTDARTGNNDWNMHAWLAVGIDANRIFEVSLSNITNIDLWIVGYFTTDAVFFVNGVNKSLSATTTWTDIDISADTGANTAIGAVIEVAAASGGTGYATGLRKNGSSDARTQIIYGQHCPTAIIGVDGSEILEGYIANTGTDFFLLGYIIDSATFNTNATAISLAGTGAWTDLTALPAGATGGFIEIIDTANSYDLDYGLRKNGTAENIYDMVGNHAWGMVECDASRIIEGEIESTNVDFFLVGYSTAGGPTNYPRAVAGALAWGGGDLRRLSSTKRKQVGAI